MRNFKLLLVAIMLFGAKPSGAQTNPAIVPYVNYLNSNANSAKEYVFNLFKTHDIVIICERMHPEFTQYNFLMDIIGDKRFISEVGNVFTEVGVSSLNPSLNTFLHTKDLSSKKQTEEILTYRRDLMWSVLWEPSNYTYLLKSLYNLNNNLPIEDAINLYPSDIPFIWKGADSLYFQTDVLPLIRSRDSIIASQVIRQFDVIRNSSSKHKKALVIMNYRHAFNNNFYVKDGRQIKNVAWFLFKRYGNSVANVLLNCNWFDMNDNSLLIQRGKWDAAFAATGNQTAGFNFMNTPFGKDSFDLWAPGNAGFTYQDVFTGFVFYNPIEDQKLITGVPGFLDSAYLDEFIRRYQLARFVPTNMKQLTEAEIAEYKKNPQDMERDINEQKERRLPNIDSLIKARSEWLK
jgi:hypothetical protein